MARFNAAILDTAGQFLGLDEWPGARHNPAILEMFDQVGHGWVKDDETPWCAAFVGSVLSILGLPHTGKLNARSYDTYGEAVALKDVKPGDIVRFSRGDPNGPFGHVGFVVRFEGDRVIVRGGNQGNSVTDAPYPVSRIQAVRRATGTPVVDQQNRQTIREDSKGPQVRALQERLAELNYFSGAVDGAFGPLTQAAVLAFQAEHDLKKDGVVGPHTWAALDKAKPRILNGGRESTTAKDLRQKGSVIATEAGRLKTIVEGGGAVGTVAVVVTQASETADLIERANGVFGRVGAVVIENWPVILIVVGGYIVWRMLNRIEEARVNDARTGKHIGR